jgi:hypothetical protein
MQLHEAAREHEADAEPTRGVIQPMRATAEEVEDVPQVGGRDPDPIVHDAHDGLTFRGDGRDPDLPARVRVGSGIVQQVREHLPQTDNVAIDRQRGIRQRDLHPVLASPDERPRRLDGMVDDGTQIDQLPPQNDPACGDAGHVEQIVDQPGQLLDLALDQGAGLVPGR